MTDVIEDRGARPESRDVGPMRLRDYPLMVGPFTHLTRESERLATLRWRHFEAVRLSPTIGAELTGLTISADLADDVVGEIRRALFEYKVIFFRDQPMTAAEHTRFASRFGELELHPFIASNTDEPKLVRFEKSDRAGGYENLWHHDVTWREFPSMGALLHAVEVPELGGDTLFSDMYAAYESLDEQTKEQIEGLEAVHDFTQTFGGHMPPDELRRMQEMYPAVRHPVVCTHTGTGRRHLYVNRAFTDRIEGLAPDESRALLDRLCRQADYPEHQCRFRWARDAVAFWDNRAVQHYATSDYYPHKRIMERASVVGGRPAR